MKTRLLVSLIAALSLLVAACGDSTDEASEVDAGSDAAEVVEGEAETEAEDEEVAEPEETTTDAPADTEPPADQTTVPAEEEAPAEEAPAEEAPAEEEPAEEEPAEEEPAEEEPAEEEVPGGPIDGMAIYEENCARCHSSDGSGGRGANIQGISAEQPETTGGIEIVTNGGRGMPDFAEDLTAEEIEAVVNYVWDTF